MFPQTKKSGKEYETQKLCRLCKEYFNDMFNEDKTIVGSEITVAIWCHTQYL